MLYSFFEKTLIPTYIVFALEIVILIIYWIGINNNWKICFEIPKKWIKVLICEILTNAIIILVILITARFCDKKLPEALNKNLVLFFKIIVIVIFSISFNVAQITIFGFEIYTKFKIEDEIQQYI